MNLADVARELVYNKVKKECDHKSAHPTFSRDEVLLVWFSKTLQNWKALVITTLPEDLYYEVTFDGNKRVAYIDTYVKLNNEEVAI